ncbi:MAG: ribose 5-phosphate isomerase B [Propionibacteriaceae bacterium]|jgi:ribose 5-phosphate isomerase B|nr:ribose 5-phosphate isomerase B [Propionibacteriaceae bacterium]
MHIILANDHAGVELKQIIAAHLTESGHSYTNLGTDSTASTDYPLYGSNAARMVAAGEGDFGILICGAGVGMCISANKVRGARCVLATEPFTAHMGRAHNNANLLALGARVVGPDLAKAIVDEFLATPFEGGERHSRRVDELAELDAGAQLPLP